MQNSIEFRRWIPEAQAHELDVSMPLGRITGRLLELFSFQATSASGAFKYDWLAPGADILSRVSVLDEHDHDVNGMLSLDELMARVSGGVDGKEQRVGP